MTTDALHAYFAAIDARNAASERRVRSMPGAEADYVAACREVERTRANVSNDCSRPPGPPARPAAESGVFFSERA